MALGHNVGAKLDTLVKRLHFLGAPKAGNTECIETCIVLHRMSLLCGVPWNTLPFWPLQILSACVILLALCDNVVIFSEAS